MILATPLWMLTCTWLAPSRCRGQPLLNNDLLLISSYQPFPIMVFFHFIISYPQEIGQEIGQFYVVSGSGSEEDPFVLELLQVS